MWLIGLTKEIWQLLAEMAPYLLLGFAVAGLLHVLIPKGAVFKHLAKNDLASIVKATLLGIPLPLCSCGVVPVAGQLRKDGASKSSVLSFLVSTPTTGVDSILATYALLGPLFAVIRPLAALFGGVMAGGTLNLIEKEDTHLAAQDAKCVLCGETHPHSHSWSERFKHAFAYGFYELVRDLWKWLVIGIIAGGLISFLVPGQLIESYLGSPALAYPMMLILGIPMYVCATGSIPIAAALIIKGMTPGAGLVFLIAGPATNMATLSFVAGKMGKRAVAAYLTTIAVSSLLFGGIIDYIWVTSGRDFSLISGGMQMVPAWLENGSALLLVAIIVFAALPKRRSKLQDTAQQNFSVKDMTCDHCVRTITRALEPLPGVTGVSIDLQTKLVTVSGTAKRGVIVTTIEKAGYSVGR
jgi:uncharacterized membrane protein YraQ (UPF0718 family)/copper chaperone CopZ